MNYRLLWKILLKNIWVCFAALFALAILFYRPLRTTYNAVTRYSNVAVYEINYSFQEGVLLWFSIVLFLAFELMVQIKNIASQELWIAAKESVYKSVFLFFVIFSLTVSGVIFLYQTILFLLFGKGIMIYLLRVWSDIFFYYFIVGIIAALLALVFSFLKKQLAALILLIGVIIAVSPVMLEIEGIAVHSVVYFFGILPRGTEAAYDLGIGVHIDLFTIGAQLLWISLTAFFLFFLLRHRRKSAYFFSAAAALFGIIIVITPHAERCGIASYRPENNIYYAFDVYDIDTEETDVGTLCTNADALAGADFAVTKYEMDIQVRMELSNTVTMWVDNAALSFYCFTLYHQYEVSAVTDQNGNALAFMQEGDILKVTGTGEVFCITVNYHGIGAPCMADLEFIRLYAGFPWYPYPGEQTVVSAVYDADYDAVSTGYTHCENNVCDYEVQIHSFLQVYANLEKTSEIYTGRTDLLMLTGGMMTEIIEGKVHYIYPVELSYYYQYNNGIESWQEAMQDFLSEQDIVVNESEDYYIIYGNEFVFNRSPDAAIFVRGDNILMYNWPF